VRCYDFRPAIVLINPEIFMSQDANDLRMLLDRAAIHDVLNRYYQGIDQGDAGKVRRCFTEDIVAKFDDRPLVRGLDALMDNFFVFKAQQSGDWKITTHFMGNLNFNALESDVAETETNAIAFLVLPGASAMAKEQVAMRSLRYLDTLRRTKEGWKICVRQHTLDWSCHVPASYAVSLGQRLTKRPEF
jgi:ketosteroid isomerase-like protein